MTDQDKILVQIAVERSRQDKQWGGKDHDDTNTEANWVEYINKQVVAAATTQDPVEARSRMIKIAALAVAAVEAIDRQSE